MLMRERLLVDVCCQQRRTRFLHRQAPTVARYRDKTYITCICMEGGMIEKMPDTNPPPVLSTKETSRTIQCCFFCILSCHQLVIGEVARRCDGTAKRKPPRLHINWMRRIGDPA